MPSLLLVVFAFQLLIHIINSVGAAALNDALWSLYNKLPIAGSTSSAVQKTTTLRKEMFQLNKELNATSAQDNFAKWAKLRRQLDKTTEDHDKLAQSLTTAKSTFDSRIGTLRFLVTTILRLGLQYWYAREAMYWVPKGWLPHYAEWIISWPRAPLGSVSIQMWFIACGSVIGIISEALVAVVALALEGVQKRRLERAKSKVASEKKTT